MQSISESISTFECQIRIFSCLLHCYWYPAGPHVTATPCVLWCSLFITLRAPRHGREVELGWGMCKWPSVETVVGWESEWKIHYIWLWFTMAVGQNLLGYTFLDNSISWSISLSSVHKRFRQNKGFTSKVGWAWCNIQPRDPEAHRFLRVAWINLVEISK